ncbi:MAG: histidine kinase [Flavobacteriaceae bacterium]|nr:MAG: histidine kinase [Flavobacteriaceae bacterium]
MNEDFNLKYIDELSEGDPIFKQQLIDIIKLELPSEILIYQKNIKEKLFVKAADSVHKIKHKINILGLNNSYNVADKHENKLNNKNPELHDSFDFILSRLVEFVKNL